MADESDYTESPDDYDVMAAVVHGILMELNTCGPGVVEKVTLTDSGKIKCVDVRPVLQRKYLDDDGKPVLKGQPVITDVPVVFPAGGGYGLTFPLAKGDRVLLVFAQRSLDKWAASDGKTDVDPDDVRRHHISDAIALAGLGTLKAPIATAHAENVVLAKEDDSVHLQITPAGEIQMKAVKVRLGADGADKGLARADLVDARLAALETQVTLPHTGNMGAPTIPPPFSPGNGGATTASTKVFTDA